MKLEWDRIRNVHWYYSENGNYYLCFLSKRLSKHIIIKSNINKWYNTYFLTFKLLYEIPPYKNCWWIVGTSQDRRYNKQILISTKGFCLEALKYRHPLFLD